MSEQVTKAPAEVKGSSGSSKDQILVKVRGQDNMTIQFRIKRGTPFKKLMIAYCEKQGVQLDSMRFRFDGHPISQDDTPNSIDIEDDDTIEAYTPQTGGYWWRH